MPKYEQIAQDIRKSIEGGALAPGDRLPTVVELCDLYGVSKITVRKAVEQLAEQGFVSSRRGSGTYVKASPEAQGSENSAHGGDALYMGRKDRSIGFMREHQNDGTVTSDIYEFEVVEPPAEIAQRLDMEPGDFAYHDVRVRRLDGVPIVQEDTYMPLDLASGLKRQHLETSIYDFLRNEKGLKLSSFHRIMRAVAASKVEAERLDIKPNDPLFEIEQIGFLDDGVPFEYSVSRNVGSRTEMHDVNLT